MSDTSISIIIPVYNEERYLKACLNAVAQQTIKPIEVIVVDNNSTDKTRDIAEKFAFVRVMDAPQQGRIYAQAIGFAAAKGTIFARIDADTIIPKDWVATILRELGSAAAITGNGYFYDAPFTKVTSILQVFFYQYLQYLVIQTYTLWGANMAIRSEAWTLIEDKVLKYPHLDEDIIASIALRQAGEKIKYTPTLSVKVSLRRGQLNFSETIKYLSTWPRDYFVMGMPFRAAAISVLTGILISLCALPSLLASVKARMRN